jgi:hypothetical protein
MFSLFIFCLVVVAAIFLSTTTTTNALCCLLETVFRVRRGLHAGCAICHKLENQLSRELLWKNNG